MKIEAVVTAVAEAERRIEPAFWDPPHVVFVQVVALIAFLAETSKPMLAYRTLVWITQRCRAWRQEVEMTWLDVPSRAGSAARTLQTFCIVGTDLCIVV